MGSQAGCDWLILLGSMVLKYLKEPVDLEDSGGEKYKNVVDVKYGGADRTGDEDETRPSAVPQ